MDTLYVKHTNYRKKRFRIVTKIVQQNGRKFVVKEAENDDSKQHILRIAENAELLRCALKEKVNICPFENRDGQIYFPFIEGERYTDILKEMVRKGDRKAFDERIKKYLLVLEMNEDNITEFSDTEGFCKWFADEFATELEGCSALKLSNLDMTPDNLIVRSDNQIVLIDYEWVIDFLIPRDFVVYRNLWFLYFEHEIAFSNFITFENLLEQCGVTMNIDLLNRLNVAFHCFITGEGTNDISNQKLFSYYQKKVVEAQDLQQIKENHIYLDSGEGLSEEEKFTFISEGSKFCFETKLKSCVQTMRFDPDNGRSVVLKDLHCYTDKGELFPYNVADRIDGALLILSEPSYLYFSLPKDVSEIKITGEFVAAEAEKSAVQEISRLHIQKDELKQEQSHLQERLEKKENQITEITSDLNERTRQIQNMVNSTSWKVTKLLRKAGTVARRWAHRLHIKKHKDKKQLFELHQLCTKTALLVSEDGKKQEQDQLYVCVDNFRYAEGILSFLGWIFAERNQISNILLKVANKTSSKTMELVYGDYRRDVFEVFGQKHALASGISSTVSINMEGTATISLLIQVQDMRYELVLGQIANDCKTKNRTQRKNEIEIAACGMYGKLSNSKYGAFLIEHDTKAQEITYGGNQSVDIVIPVYNGYEFLPKLFEGIRRTAVQYRLFIVDDCSPDERIYPYLESIKEANTVLIKNEKNVGFVMSVNAALAQTENDVVLLNTDVELPPFWLERLMNPIFTDDRVATATPFTNSGTICSFPCIGTDNPIMEGLSVDEMDKAFQTIEPIYTVMPTGVGFCMAMSRQAINQIGLLDEQAFEKGYGEENDWCQRAIAAGYKNVMVENLFVYHKHGGSFLSDEKKRLIERNQKILQERYPRYRYEVAEYFSQDPLKYLRNWIALNILSAATKKSPRLIWNHGIGGGADAYIRKEIERDTKLGKQSILAWYDVYSGYYIAEYCYKNYQLRFFAREIDSLTRLFDLTGVDEVVINELVSYPDIIHTLELILQIKEKHGSQLVILMHDFFAVCPCCTLLNAQDTFCNVPQNLLVCNACLAASKNLQNEQIKEIVVWRQMWWNVIEQADEILAFSNSTAELLRMAYPQIKHVTVKPHIVDYMIPLEKRYKTSKTLNIGLMGILTLHKGANIIKQILAEIKEKQLDIKIVLMGQSMAEFEDENLIVTGKYEWQDIPKLTLQYDIDLFFIASVVPETFSYTAEEAMKMEMPVVCFEIGAPAERVKDYSKGLVLKEFNGEKALKEIGEWVAQKQYLGLYANQEKILFIIEEESFASRYRVDHFREELLFCGVASDCIKSSEITEVNTEDYFAAVVYRCYDTKKMKQLIKKMHSEGKQVWYDIDDYIFDYQKIKELGFLKGREYTAFQTECSKIKECMQRCDSFFTSTEVLKKKIEKDFKGKQCVVNRNSASVAMRLLSNKAEKLVQKDENKVILGYFSGSKTHDADFETIVSVIEELFERYQNVFLRIVGCLNLPSNLSRYSNRIIQTDFVKYTKLPSIIAETDINLMPLEKGVFHAAKSENKWLEAALVGVPTVAQRNEELEQIIENDKTGFLCEDAQEWQRTLILLVENIDLRMKIGKEAKRKVLSDCMTYTAERPAVNAVIKKRNE